jgi:hypothetical protein
MTEVGVSLSASWNIHLHEASIASFASFHLTHLFISVNTKFCQSVFILALFLLLLYTGNEGRDVTTDWDAHIVVLKLNIAAMIYIDISNRYPT